ncbi:family 1 glycosylhydrolase, partial [Candidatus Gottesmanbacteria bacterium]|nr:family 1 glycosylhydrolase [Candidatus Gottesmanbacteria bacterium]
YKGSYPQDLLEIYGSYFSQIMPYDLKIISAKTDFLGVNYYTSAWVEYSNSNPPLNFSFSTPKWVQKTNFGWAIYPKGLSEVLERLKAFDIKKIYITENGAAFKDKLIAGRVKDNKRLKFLRDHLKVLSQSIQNGSPVEGFLLWSFMDNFEWQEGLIQRFGVFYTDYDTQKRIIKDSGKFYKKIISSELA